MKIILSRKGFDAFCGGIPSPILPDGAMVSLPIPERATHVSRRYGDIRAGNVKDDDGPLTMGRLVNDLTGSAIRPDAAAHLDPDLNPAAVPRWPGWRPMFGQTGAAERHLRNQGVGPGDLFLFFGWFRQVERHRAGRFRYVPGAPDLHVIFGWQQIERRAPAADSRGLPVWAAGHPHYEGPARGPLDCIYFATERLRRPGLAAKRPGGGVFPSFRPALCLTAAGQTRSVWDLPGWFHPREGRRPMSYHSGPHRWTRTGKGQVRLDTAKQGQEFVLDVDHYPEALAWARGLFEDRSPKPLPRKTAT